MQPAARQPVGQVLPALLADDKLVRLAVGVGEEGVELRAVAAAAAAALARPARRRRRLVLHEARDVAREQRVHEAGETCAEGGAGLLLLLLLLLLGELGEVGELVQLRVLFLRRLVWGRRWLFRGQVMRLFWFQFQGLS